MKKIYIEDVKQVRHFTDRHLAKFLFNIDLSDLTDKEIDTLLENLKKCTLRKNRFMIEDTFITAKYKFLECTSLHGYGYSFVDDFEDLFSNYNLIER